MKISGRHYRTLWPTARDTVRIIDQTRLPFELAFLDLRCLEDAARAIRDMHVRGAPLIGATAAYGLALALTRDPSDAGVDTAMRALLATRPTARNLGWALRRLERRIRRLPAGERADAAWQEAQRICEEDVEHCVAIGRHGLTILERRAAIHDRPLRVLTHCNAGWLACIDWGTALAPLYCAHDAGLEIEVWVDETRPRNQGAALTAFELGAHGIAHTVITDNLGGLLMQRGEVDLVIVGADRVTACGDVCNKVGTYLKALAARDNEVPFYVAFPSSTLDGSLESGREVPIEERSAREVTHVQGRADDGRLASVQVVPDGSPALNLAFDVTPARLVTGFITERGVSTAGGAGIAALLASHARVSA